MAKSFREEDRLRIRPVETFLESFAKLGVETETGEPSEPESVSLKVRDRIDRADVFVAVLTARFPICPMQERFQAIWNSILGRIAAWSAPAWVLQECGYAIARGCDLILFLEPDVDLGGLQGDYEYIQYDYRNPAPALTRASFMLHSLIARHLGAVMQTTIDVSPEVPPAQVSLSSERLVNEAPAPEEDDALEPIFEPIFLGIIEAFNERNFKKAEQLFEDGKKVLAEQSTVELEIPWTILYYSRLFKAGMTEGLDGLRAMAKLHPESPRIPKAIADCLMSYNEYEEASIQLRRAEELSKSPERYEYILQRCTCLLKEGNRADAKNLMLALVNGSVDASSEFRSRLMMALFSMFKESDALFFGFAIAEVGLRENPGDATLRFRLGYEYSEAKYFELDAFHTKALVDHDPKDAGSTHNLAVAFHNLSMPVASVSHYKRALDLGESLSASNMGYKLIEAGFADECETMLNAALQKPQCAPEVQQTLARLYRERHEEDQKLGPILEEARRQRDYLMRFGEGVIDRCTISIDGIWQNDFGSVTFNVSGQHLIGRAEKTTEETISAYLLGALGTHTGLGTPNKTRHTFSLEGDLLGRACWFRTTITSTPEGRFAPTEKTEDGYIVFRTSMIQADVVKMTDGKLGPIEVINKQLD